MRLFSLLALALAACAPVQPSVARSPSASQAQAQAAMQAGPVQFRPLSVPDGEGPAIEAGVWLPGEGPGPWPLIVISHGTGGGFRGHEATARALAAQGFAVAALTHGGDNWRDRSRTNDAAERPRQLVALTGFLLDRWEGRGMLDAGRVGAFGFSYGGFTVLTAAGGRPDLGRMIDHCRRHPDFYDCRLFSQGGLPPAVPAEAWSHESRIRAVVVAAPALGFSFDRAGLADVTQPVQLWRAENDAILPSPHYAEPVRAALPRAPEYHLAEGAGHFDFMPECSTALAAAAPEICISAPGFDRAAFQARFNAELVRFFRETLK